MAQVFSERQKTGSLVAPVTPTRHAGGVTQFPKLEVAPGAHLIEIFHEGRKLHGQVVLEAERWPSLDLIDDVEEIDFTSRTFVGGPKEYEFPRLVGQMASKQDVVLIDISLLNWWIGRSQGKCRYAIAGLGVADVPDDRYHRVRFQITEAELLFGIAPIKSVHWPAQDAPPDQPYSAVINDASSQEWRDDGDGLTVNCSFDHQFTLSDPFRHELVFAPVIQFAADDPMTVDEWLELWVVPFLETASLATRKPQRLSWLTVHTGPNKLDTSGVVFAHGIDQAPSVAAFRDEWRDPNALPLFSFNALPTGLPEFLRGWRTLRASDNPFIELSQLALNQPDLPQRARFLYLIQALEALHGFEHRVTDEASQERFIEKRQEAIDEISTKDVSVQSLKFIKEKWGKRRPDSLSRRLREILAELPPDVRSQVETPEMSTIAAELAAESVTTLEGQMERLRNDLSHGNRNYPSRDLQPWVTSVELICRANLLRLLGFDATAVTNGLFRATRTH